MPRTLRMRTLRMRTLRMKTGPRTTAPVRAGQVSRLVPAGRPGRPGRPAGTRRDTCPALTGAVVLGPVFIRRVLIRRVLIRRVLGIQRRRVAGRQPLQAQLQVLPLAPLDHGPFPVVGWLAIAW